MRLSFTVTGASRNCALLFRVAASLYLCEFPLARQVHRRPRQSMCFNVSVSAGGMLQLPAPVTETPGGVRCGAVTRSLGSGRGRLTAKRREKLRGQFVASKSPVTQGPRDL